MARIIGVDIPDNKRLEVALTYIYGIGRKLSNQIIAKLGLDPNMRAHKLSEDEFLASTRCSNRSTSSKETYDVKSRTTLSALSASIPTEACATV